MSIYVSPMTKLIQRVTMHRHHCRQIPSLHNAMGITTITKLFKEAQPTMYTTARRVGIYICCLILCLNKQSNTFSVVSNMVMLCELLSYIVPHIKNLIYKELRSTIL